MMKAKGYTIEGLGGGGGGMKPEEYLPGVGPRTSDSSYVDVTVVSPTGTIVRIQTVDTLADGMTMTTRELDAFNRIRAQTNGIVIAVPKTATRAEVLAILQGL
jgi:hypothetical protein